MPEMFAEEQAAKPCAQHDDVKCLIARHGLNFNELAGNAKPGVYQNRMTFILAHGLMPLLHA
jgi:hypothetical protein